MIRKRALFVTTHTHDTWNHIDAWDSVAEVPAKRIHFNFIRGLGVDNYILSKAKQAGPIDVIFYIGCNQGATLPSYDTLLALRKIAPTVNVVSDAADGPWHPVIARYRKVGCFDLHVGIDGDPASPVDLVTLTPVDSRPWGRVPKDIRCGFSGNTGGKRQHVLGAIGSRVWVRVRGEDYQDHINFLCRCKMILNIAFTGTGNRFHCKGRVTETGYAHAALLEPSSSPTKHWLKPHVDYLPYDTPEHARDIIDNTSEEYIAHLAGSLASKVREKYNAETIYGSMLEKLNLVDHPIAV